MKITAKTFHGIENVLADELEKLGAGNIKPLTRAVSYTGDKELLYKSNLHLRTALKVLVPVYYFNAKSEAALYNKVFEYDWSKHLKIDQTFAISSAVHSDRFRHSKFVALKVKDAIVDQFRKRYGRRPSVDVDNAEIRFNVHASGTDFTISLDSSGDSLHKRGYRSRGHDAPLNEALAASMILLSGWNKELSLLDPMCGSGTLLLEAGMIACNIPPGINRKSYSFMNWPDYDDNLWIRIYNDTKVGIASPTIDLRGSDLSAEYIDLSKASARMIGLSNKINFYTASFEDVKPASDSGVIVMNPPYGERLNQKDINAFYKMIGDNLKQKFSGFDAWILSSNKDALKNVGLRPSQKLTLFNGALECKYQKFSLYKGSLKRKYREDNSQEGS